MKKKLSLRQMQIYRFIEKYIDEHKFPPSLQDISRGLGMPASTLTAHVNGLKKKRALTSQEGTARSFRLFPENVEFGPEVANGLRK
jgi:DNA-binding IclR family transcriptional regulator